MSKSGFSTSALSEAEMQRRFEASVRSGGGGAADTADASQRESSFAGPAPPEQDRNAQLARHRSSSAVAGLALEASSPGADSHATQSPASPEDRAAASAFDSPGAAAAAAAASASASAAAATVVVKMNDLATNSDKFPDNYISTSKYTWYSFLPLCLLFQFRAVSTFYFLLVGVFSLIPGVSPFSAIISLAPLIFVVGVGMIKDGYEDFVRHRSDARANAVVAHALRKDEATGQWALVDIESADVRVGDVLQVRSGEEIRADLLLLSSTGAESSCFIETCNLDGETNLKSRKAVPESWHIKDIASAVAADVTLRTTEPSPHLHHWGGVLVVNGHETAVGIDQFLYRSAILKNTESAWAVVVYAGVDTKMFRNLEERPPKMSHLDVKLNWLIAVVMLIKLCILILCAGLMVGFNTRADGHHWYLQRYATQSSSGATFGLGWLTLFILFSYLVPISLFVTIELCKVAQAKLMEWDHDMFEWMHGKWQHCTANTSNLNEQLSQIKFIFSDKTGTLTENVMKFKLGDALGLPIESDDWSKSQAQMHDERMQRYMRALALCHTVQPFHDETAAGGLKYDGESPDELALVETAKAHGVELRDRFVRSIRLAEPAGFSEWEILATLKFTPDRKMMSLVVRNPVTNRIEIYTKGADSFVKDRLAVAANAPYLDATQARLDEMAATGLRTLMVCYREIEQAEFDAWYVRFTEAGKALVERSRLVDQACLLLEKELVMVGITAIEDKLQDQVPETIRFFMDAGVVVWMLTGDKRETALTIAATSSLTVPGEDVVEHIDIHHRKPSDPECPAIVQQQLETIRDHLDRIDKAFAEERALQPDACSGSNARKRRVCFVIDGPALTVAMEHLMDLFVDISQRVASAVCCRLTPLQKASVVRMFQQQTGETALAIGDGANDVSMIGEGKVGIGIVGLEGAQAALAADYAIPRFKHLRNLCAVHGRYALLRNALCILFSFYKNFLISTTLILYAFHNPSGASIYDGWLLTFYNIVFTSIPPWIVGMFEKDVPEARLLSRPALFTELSRGAYFGGRELALWFVEAIVHGIFVFYVYLPAVEQNSISGSPATGGDNAGRLGDVVSVSSAMNAMVIALVLTKLALHIRHWNVIFAGAFAVCVIIYFAFVATQSVTLTAGSGALYGLDSRMWDSPLYWAYLFLGCTGLTMADLFFMSLWRRVWPSAIDKENGADKDAAASDDSGEPAARPPATDHPLRTDSRDKQQQQRAAAGNNRRLDSEETNSAPYHPEDGGAPPPASDLANRHTPPNTGNNSIAGADRPNSSESPHTIARS